MQTSILRTGEGRHWAWSFDLLQGQSHTLEGSDSAYWIRFRNLIQRLSPLATCFQQHLARCLWEAHKQCYYPKTNRVLAFHLPSNEAFQRQSFTWALAFLGAEIIYCVLVILLHLQACRVHIGWSSAVARSENKGGVLCIRFFSGCISFSWLPACSLSHPPHKQKKNHLHTLPLLFHWQTKRERERERETGHLRLSTFIPSLRWWCRIMPSFPMQALI